MKAKDIAKYILLQPDTEADESISNMKLQKLLYYVQGFHLAMTGKPLFEDEIHAWEHGPVVPSVYREYKSYGSSGITTPINFKINSIPAESKNVIDQVYATYGQYSAWGLRNLSHKELPWINTPKGEIIPKEVLKTFFLTQIED